MKKRIYDELGAANTPEAQGIRDIMEPALRELIVWLEANDVDLSDAMGYCQRLTNFHWCKASIEDGLRRHVQQRENPDA